MNNTLKEAKRLYDLGFAIIWIHPKGKRPIESGWTSGSRTPWKKLEASYKPGYNVGVRTGEPSKIGDNYLACIDIDVKEPTFKNRAIAKVKELFGSDVSFPRVLSGSGGGSQHLYCVTREPFKMITVLKEKDKGEVCIYSNGRQMVLPPSHTINQYTWATPLDVLPLIDVEPLKEQERPKNEKSHLDVNTISSVDFVPVDVELAWLPIDPKVLEGITKGIGVKDRSAYIMKAANALMNAGLDQNEVLSVLTDPNNYLGQVGYDHAQTKNRKKAADWVYKYSLAKVEADKSFFDSPIVESKTIGEEEMAENAIEFAPTWRQTLDRTKDGGLKGTVKNVVTILQNEIDPSVVRRNLVAYRDTYIRDTPWGGVEGAVVSDDDDANVKFWLGKNYGFEPRKETIMDAFTVIAMENSYDPVKDWLESLPPWDKKPRLNTWLRKNFGAVGEGAAADEYFAQVFRKWMVAMVMRVYEPGSKFDWMPIFEGKQGVGKSSFGRLLVGDQFFLDWLPNLTDKDSALGLQGMWGVEMGELSQFRKNELEVIKAFITRTVDKVRPPYGRRMVESARRCVFFGTTNRETYLIDESGNRRFKPLILGRLNFKALERDREQLFAEAKHLYDSFTETERTLELSGIAQNYEREIQGEKMVEDEASLMEQAMLTFKEKVLKKETSFNFKNFRILDLFEKGAGPLENWRADNRSAQFAAKMLKKIKATKKKVKGLYYWEWAIFENDPAPPYPTKEDVISYS